MKSSKRTGRLGTQLRGKLAEAYDQRGHQTSSLWYVYSPRTAKDWVIPSDRCYDHFVLTEADPHVVDADYTPQLDIPTLGVIRFAAIVRYDDDVVQWHYLVAEDAEADSKANARLSVVADAAEHANATLRCFGPQDLEGKEQLLWNWQRVLAWMTAARGASLAPYMVDISAYITPLGSTTLGDLMQLGSREASPLYAAAAFRLVQKGVLETDLHLSPLSTLTSITKREQT